MRVRGVIVTAMVLAGAAGAAEAAGTPAIDEISLERARVLYKDGNFKDALTTLSKLQEARTGVDRFALFMLKAEAQMRLGDSPMALTSLGMAHKEGEKPEQKMQAAALELLVRKSPGLTFKPRIGEPGRSFDIVADGGRKDAFEALLADETEAAGKRLALALAARDLATLAENARPLATYRAVEYAVTGKTAASEEMTAKYREKLTVLVSAELTKDEGIVKTLQANADKVIAVWINFTDPNGWNRRRQEWHKQGPTTYEKSQLTSLKTMHERLAVQINEMVTDLSITPETMKIHQTRNTTLLTNINAILTADYDRPTTRPAGG
jgi:hypothetical protein